MKKIIILFLITQSIFSSSNGQNIISTIAGDGLLGYSGDKGIATSASLNNPGSVSLDTSGNIYIADYGNNVIRKVNILSKTITTIAGNGTSGSTGDSGPATDASLNGPSCVAVDSFGNVYIADVFNNVIRKVAVGSGIITTIAGNATTGYSGDGGPATDAQISVPAGIFISRSGSLYIAEFGNNVIRKVNKLGVISTVAGSHVSGFFGDGAAATLAKLMQPNGICVDAHENLYIADASNHRIRKVDNASGVITTIAGTGVYGNTGDGGSALSAELGTPVGITLDASANFYISDVSNNVVRMVDISTGIINTIAGNGTSGFSGDGGTATIAQLAAPESVCVGKNNIVYIADAGNNVIREIVPVSLRIKLANINSQILISPNPFTNSITIKNQNGIEAYAIYDLLGRSIVDPKRITGNYQEISIPLDYVSPGIYILNIRSSKNESENFKIIKQ